MMKPDAFMYNICIPLLQYKSATQECLIVISTPGQKFAIHFVFYIKRHVCPG